MTLVDAETSDAWATGAGPPVPPAETGTVTAVEGSTFCVSSTSGDMLRDFPHGLFVADTRIVSCWKLAVDGQAVETLTALEDPTEPYRVTFVGRTAPHSGHADSTVLVLRHRYVGDGMREDVVLRNLGREATGVTLSLTVTTDFADLFEVKQRRVNPAHGVVVDVGADALTYQLETPTDVRGSRITATGDPGISPGRFTFHLVIPARSEWSTCLSVEALVGGRRIPPRHRCGAPVQTSPPARRMQAWRLAAPSIRTPDTVLADTLRASARDLGALQIEDPDHPDCPVVAAGAPWFMALFGRDCLLTSWMALPLDPRLARCSLRTLARLQGRKSDPLTEEQPGRILHEVRMGREAGLALGGGNVYYGTVDATPLFVMLVGELHRWGELPDEDLRALLPAVDRALTWIADYGDLDGDGFVEYRRHTDRGLANQGWKDSFDGVNHADGRLAVPPIALCEVQGYAYAAFRARAAIATTLGDPAAESYWRGRAATLKSEFNHWFWMDDREAFAIALDGDKEQVDAVTSNMGHCLWTGIVDDEKAPAVARHLSGERLDSGFGVRTLANDMGAYNPMSYHNGSVWPHDSAIAVAGLARYGFVEQAQRIALEVLDASARFGDRLPELYCGFDREQFSRPVPYPTSCSPQAWAAASPLLLTRSLLRLDPDLPAARVGFDPVLPERMLPLRIENVPLGGGRIDLEIRSDGWELDGLPDEVALDAGPQD
ncbi:glycogen debranching N-terminal domain-containing protein [Pseudonocardia acidicola]|uniref:Amylo-alpha-1,6-glucosidase n=1 Tax=Pseudonocardia acidicola TaxID=2724939 RepID=A0ABX1S6B3_9PSEU|nr:glycogen debranching N-terminal domain-containing protein [Pseudonocardia acidicola]NMH96337.1 amylo-alpha-1,6-glucosidase [Pseudonocardia acidicola]